jgi:hypothetical protein
LLYLSTCDVGREKVTARWPVLDDLTTMALPLVLGRLERVRCAIGCKVVGGVDVLITLGDGTPTVGAGICVDASITLVGDSGVVALITLGGGATTGRAGVGVCMPTLGADAWVGASCKLGGPPVGMLRMARRLSTASSWA